MLGRQQSNDITKIQKIGKGVVDIGDRKFVFKFGYLLVKGSYNVIGDFSFLLGHIIFGMVTKYNITFYIAGRFGKYC